jgi:methyltransferase (TIGR00027 family)
VEVPANVRFAAADLSEEPLGAALTRAGFSGAVPAFFSWLGVTIYLSEDANLATLGAIATSSAPGSELVFTYLDQRVLDARRSPALARRASLGEPWVSGFDPVTLAATLERLGLVLLEDLPGRELTARYCAGRTDALSAGVAGHIVHARITAR